MEVAAIANASSHIIFVIFSIILLHSGYSSIVVYRKYAENKLDIGISSILISLSIIAIEISTAFIALFFSENPDKLISRHLLIAINIITIGIFCAFLYFYWRRLISGESSEIIRVIRSRRLLLPHFAIITITASTFVNIIDLSRPMQAFSINFSAESRNAHMYFGGNSGLKYNPQRGTIEKNDDALYGIILNVENQEFFPLIASVQTYASYQNKITMNAIEEYETFDGNDKYIYEERVPALGTTKIPLFLSKKAIANLIDNIVAKGSISASAPLSIYAVSKLEIRNRTNTRLSDIYYINSHIHVTPESLIVNDIEFLIPTLFQEGASILSAVSVDREKNRDLVEIDIFFDLLNYSCQTVASEYELLLLSAKIRADISDKYAKSFLNGNIIFGANSSSCIYLVNEKKRLAMEKHNEINRLYGHLLQSSNVK